MILTDRDWQFLKGEEEKPRIVKRESKIPESEMCVVAELKLSGLTIADVAEKTGYGGGQIRAAVAKYLRLNPDIGRAYVKDVLAHSMTHTRRETAEKFGISPSMAHEIIAGTSALYAEYMP